MLQMYPDQLQRRGERTVATLQSLGVRGLDLGRDPDANAWLLLEIDDVGLIVVQTDPAIAGERLGVVVHGTRPPDAQGVHVLAEFAAGRGMTEAATTRNESTETWMWVLETAEGLIAALRRSSDR
jgi:hypothetical protein